LASCRRVDWNWGQDFEQSQSNHGWPRVALVDGLGTRRGSSQRSNIRTKSGPLSLRTSATRRHAWLARPDADDAGHHASRLVPIPHRLIPKAERADTRMFSPSRFEGEPMDRPLRLIFVHPIALTASRTHPARLHQIPFALPPVMPYLFIMCT